MKIRKYEGANEKDAMLKVKEELGKEALIVSVKNIKPRGFYKLFKKPYVEVTAALDDHSLLDDGDREPNFLRKRQTQKTFQQPVVQERMQEEENEAKAYLEKFKSLIDKLPDENRRDKMETQEVESSHEVVNASVIKEVYEQLIDHEVREEIVNQLTAGISGLNSDDQEEVTDVIAVVYKRIIKLLSDHATINEDKKNTVFFVGPTGVGKTTTIAKIASFFTLNMGKDVALITSDTYRIAAVEQLRTYANILNIPIKVVYTKEELTEAVNDFKDKDLILIDTAGRSHKNIEHQNELKGLLNAVDEKEVYLVLSVATGYKDLMNITSVYDTMTDYKIIFTKLDETTCYGNVLNVKLATGAKLSYVTFGQNVPDDISDINPHEIARQVLGGNE
ncbi:Flagellar biosynthesis protein FlhF [Petrocella atlantisensis]|uniref:Flagellar biosynthesis protein FlhF n=1 Tax=Petrocella atlantisensis TaxID=2173034 RepID=A0A3P7P7W5_9FIRM|nr:flagellar biosynthesis protein FlhF [Petrocella atlantisensis]VDN46303.1 Flagellar biosynthesis protein FlhF [Petrocella atlantisensis]